jgi:exopolyphosphatase/guanosine-5'-triphosphate,3'-diphosphate pyrophosphatase
MARYAAIDIGSNSLRMEVADKSPGSPMEIVASGRVVTRLGESVFRTGKVSREAADLTCQVLAGMAAQYQKLNVAGVRAVATSAVRDARNQAEFIERASAAAGAPVDVISGREEARLIHLGVQSRWPQTSRRVLIVDVGGGSVEIIASEGGRFGDAVSKPLGAVRLCAAFLAGDPAAELELHRMREFIDEKLDGVARRFGASRWDRAIATSATACAAACAIHRVPRSKGDLVDRLRMPAPQLRKLGKTLAELDLKRRRAITGIGPRRAEIIVPGVIVLARVLSVFNLASLHYCAAGVRDGIIADLAARGVGSQRAQLGSEQRQEVGRLSRRYGVSPQHSRQVAALARTLFDSLQSLHQLPLECGKLLEAAAYLHDVGHFVSDQSHHKHSYYLVANSGLPGFTNRERELIACLCRYHRKSLPAPRQAGPQLLTGEENHAVLRLIPLLRLADSLDRSHTQRVQSIECGIQNGQVTIRLSSPRGKDIDLELWAAERAAAVFRQVYGMPIVWAREDG